MEGTKHQMAGQTGLNGYFGSFGIADFAGTRVDVRSVSRVGRSDLGTNARRIRRFLEAVQAASPRG